jgi:hypothetical protein
MTMEALKPDTPPKAVKKLRSKILGPSPLPGNDPIDALRLVVREHRNLTRFSVATSHMGLTEVTLRNGDKAKRDIPASASAALKETSTKLAEEADAKKRVLARCLKGIPIYDAFFKHVTFAVPMLASYLIAEVDIRKCGKSSQLRRFCGLAVINGRLERLTKGHKRGYNATLRTQLFLAFDSLWKNQRHHQTGPNAKYLQIWKDSKHRDLQKEGVVIVEKNGETKHQREVGGKMVAWDGHAHKYGWHKSADILIEDLYIVWRALEGLPVWPSYYAAKLGYEHGGKIAVNAPKMLTIDEALELVGLNDQVRGEAIVSE